jgi:hypothetical protein
VIGESFLGDAALDDIEIEEGACPTEASCDFESGYCGYYNTQEEDDFDWLRGKGRVYYYTGPAVDHTTNTAAGYYAFINPTSDMQAGKFLFYFNNATLQNIDLIRSIKKVTKLGLSVKCLMHRKAGASTGTCIYTVIYLTTTQY